MKALGIDIGGTRVKAAMVDSATGVPSWTWTSAAYAKPAVDELERLVRSAVLAAPASPASVGLCIPGVVDARTGTVVRCVNIPGLEGTDPVAVVRRCLRDNAPAITRWTDAYAAGVDVRLTEGLEGRLLAISLGTGVGAAVIDDGCRQLVLHGHSSGHFGQMDVSLSEEAPLGPDGGRGSLEAYIGGPALMRRWGDPATIAASLETTSEPVRALARAIRIAHAIYKPDHVRLLGGVGLALARLGEGWRDVVARDLTCVAKPGWTLGHARHEHHAAVGAARLSGGVVTSVPPRSVD
ncbi:MAG: ROK family protein [Phycisphaerae bacterium]